MDEKHLSQGRDYEKIFNQFIEYENRIHERNQKKIRTGLKVNLILPQCFLILCFATKSSKLFFLILWIVSLFGIAFYLIYVEYKDYQMQELLSGNHSDEEFNPLIGAPAELIEAAINNRMDMAGERIDSVRQAALDMLTPNSKDDENETEQEDGDA